MDDPTEGRNLGRALRTAMLLVAIAALLGTLLVLLRHDARVSEEPTRVEPLPENVDLLRHQETFKAGVEALRSNDARAAIAALGSFSFGKRAVEEYRLYYLANAQELAGDRNEARRNLSHLWVRRPRFVARHDAGFNLSALYREMGDWTGAARIEADLARDALQPAVRATAHLAYMKSRGMRGDVGAIMSAARTIVVDLPRVGEVAEASDVLRALIDPEAKRTPLPLTRADRIRRIESLVTAGMIDSAEAELRALDATALQAPLRGRFQLARATIAQNRGRYEESERELAALLDANGPLTTAALRVSVDNLGAIAGRLAALQTRRIARQVKDGSIRVLRQGRMVRVPRYRVIHETIKKPDPKREAQRQAILEVRRQRLEILGSTGADDDIRVRSLHALAKQFEMEKNEEGLRKIVAELAPIDPATDEGLQMLWDAGWASYERNYDAGAIDRFDFIRSTYQKPAIQRQASYWIARCMQRRGEMAGARKIFEELASSHYEDLYTLLSRDRLGRARHAAGSPDKPRLSPRLRVPPELQPASELVTLGFSHEARVELQANTTDANRNIASAILAETFFRQGAWGISARYLRRAFPQIATVEQDTVPLHYLRIYFANRYGDQIVRLARSHSVDPYLVMAIIHQESSFDPRARSSAGAIGLMQLMPATGVELGRKTYGSFHASRLTDPTVNLELGTRYLSQVIEMMGGESLLAIAGYNGGPYRIRGWRDRGRRPLDEFLEDLALSETRNYVKRVVVLRSSYERLWSEIQARSTF